MQGSYSKAGVKQVRLNGLSEKIVRVGLFIYGSYSRLLYPLYRRLTVESLELRIDSPDIMHPLTSSEELLVGGIHGKTILDIGTGCGIIALIAKNLGASYVLGVDINEEAISNATKNLRHNMPNVRNVEFKQSDLFQNVRDKFDLIVSYLRTLNMCQLTRAITNTVAEIS